MFFSQIHLFRIFLKCKALIPLISKDLILMGGFGYDILFGRGDSGRVLSGSAKHCFKTRFGSFLLKHLLVKL